jgi:hypothetical protein
MDGRDRRPEESERRPPARFAPRAPRSRAPAARLHRAGGARAIERSDRLGEERVVRGAQDLDQFARSAGHRLASTAWRCTRQPARQTSTAQAMESDRGAQRDGSGPDAAPPGSQSAAATATCRSVGAQGLVEHRAVEVEAQPHEPDRRDLERGSPK